MNDLTPSEKEADKNAHEARVHLLGVDLGYRLTKLVLRVLQAVGVFRKA